jgi:hypothetical protein
MTRGKLTAEDIDWLERRINAAVEPVAPRPGFVRDAKQALLRQAVEQGAGGPTWVVAAYWLVGVAAILLAVVALLRRRAR